MLQNLKIRTKIILVSVISMIVLTVLFTINIVTAYNKHFQEHLQELRIEAYEKKKEELQNYADMAYGVVEGYYKKAKQSPKKLKLLQAEALDAIKHMRYGKNGYFWINNMDNKMLMHPIKPEYDGHYFVNTPKVPFVELGTQKLKETQKQKVFIEYSFYTPATKKYSHKLSIVQHFKPWHWVIGTGAYTDYLDQKIEQEKEIAQAELQKQIQNTLIMSFVVLIFLVLIMVKIMQRIIIEPLEEFQEGLNQFFHYLDDDKTKVEEFKIHSNDEIGLMAQKTNKAIATAMKTHHELLDLRKQLERSLDKTQKDFDTITKSTNESLEYGALIQNSILPETSEIAKIFTDCFILDIQKEQIRSSFYLFEEIKPNEYVYIVLDFKERGISGVFINMLLNAIVKQALTQLKYEQKEVSTAEVLEYLNQNMEHSKKGFEASIFYYNKNQNIIRYSSSNTPLYFYQNGSVEKLGVNHHSLGIDKSVTYSEETIQIGEYIELYLSTQTLERYIDFEHFESVFQIDKELFKEHLSTEVDEDIIVCGFEIDNKPKIIIEYEGEFIQSLVNVYMEVIEDKIDNMGLMSNISTNFVEQYQNILNYGKSRDIENNEVTPFGSIVLQQNADGSYSIETKNIVTLADKEKIEPKLIEIQSLDKDGIKKRYRELRRSGKNTHQKGGGIGFYEIAKRCTKVEYSFTQINEDRFEFRFVSYIG